MLIAPDLTGTTHTQALHDTMMETQTLNNTVMEGQQSQAMKGNVKIDTVENMQVCERIINKSFSFLSSHLLLIRKFCVKGGRCT